MARVFLFNPPGPEGRGYTREGRCTQEAGIWGTQWPPVTLATTAALLDQDDHEVQIVDFPAVGGNVGLLEQKLRSWQPALVFWSTGTPTLESDLKIADTVRNCLPRAVTGVMGTHVTAVPEAALKTEAIDMVVRREPDGIIREVCRLHASGERWHDALGISYPDGETGNIRHNLDAPFLDPGEIPFPAWHHLDITRYRLPLRGKVFLALAPVRGCPYACSFCTAPVYYGKRLRQRPIEQVVDEMQSGRDRFAVRDFFLWADTFTADPRYVRAFCREVIRRGLDVAWTCNSRVDTVDRDLLLLMKEAGLWMISFGIESGNEGILQSTGKKITVGQSIEAVRAAHELGIKTAGHFILGLPGENEETMKQTLQLALDLPLDIAQFYAAAPFPGTALHGLADREGWLRSSREFSQRAAVLHLPGLSPERVNAFRRHAYREFYKRPRIWRQTASLATPASLLGLVRGSMHFLQWVRS